MTTAAGTGGDPLAGPGADQTGETIHYYFPVEIEVVAGSAPADPQQIADLALERLARGVRAT